MKKFRRLYIFGLMTSNVLFVKGTKEEKKVVLCAIEREKRQMDYSSYMLGFQPSGLYGQRQIKINTTRVILWRDETNFHGTKRPFFFSFFCFFFFFSSLRNLPFSLLSFCPLLYIAWPIYLCIFFFLFLSSLYRRCQPGTK